MIILTTYFSWLLVLGGILAMNAGASPVITAETPLGWVQPVLSTDARFGSMAQQTIGTRSSPTVQSALPYSVILSNTGSVPIVGLAVRFNITTAGKTVVRDFFYYSYFRTGNPVLAPGQMIVFTPVRSANDLVHGRASGPLNVPSDSQDLTLLASSERIHVVVDLVVAPDGRRAGQDAGKHIAQMLAQAQAFRAMGTEFVARNNAGATDADLKVWLRRFVTNQSKDRYVATQRRMAHEWTALLDSGKRSALVSIAQNFALPDKSEQFLSSIKEGLQ
jgi:hypothetical protein